MWPLHRPAHPQPRKLRSAFAGLCTYRSLPRLPCPVPHSQAAAPSSASCSHLATTPSEQLCTVCARSPGAPLDSCFLPCGGHLCSDTHLGSFWILLLGAGSAPHRAWQMFPRKNWLFNQSVCAGGQGWQRIGPTCPQEAPGHILEVPPHPCPPLRHTSPAPLLAGRLWGGGGG